jgi:small neutral amino acid transporter SnatA (MarC family)
MTLGAVDIFGPLKGMIVHAPLTAKADLAFRRKVLAAGRIVRVIRVSGVPVNAKNAGILLAALAVRWMLLALQDSGVLERTNH